MSNELKNNFVIIMPAYNEARRIAPTIAGIRKYSNADIIVVSDGSTDETVAEAKGAGASVIELPFNMGYGAALQTGFKYALKKEYEFAVQMDADGQHDPLSIEALIGPILKNEVDIVIGSRFLSEESYSAPFVRRMGMYFFGFITSVLTGRKITDPTSGFQALNKKVMEFYASRAYPVDYPDADVLIMLHRKGFRFKEVPVVMHNAAKPSMHGGIIKPLYYIFKMLLSIFMTLLRKE
ncbi:MAG: glycosyltransferase family 2 protein [Thermodesulfovibrionales bacterium]|nr:glycosyltransferase family 2 protein [Thermodesulfovibrionales bacterium]